MKPKTIKFILVFFNIVMLSSLGWSQCDGCNYPFIYWSYPDLESNQCTEIISNTSECNQSDVQLLIDIIDQNGIDESTSSIDINNETLLNI